MRKQLETTLDNNAFALFRFNLEGNPFSEFILKFLNPLKSTFVNKIYKSCHLTLLSIKG